MTTYRMRFSHCVRSSIMVAGGLRSKLKKVQIQKLVPLKVKQWPPTCRNGQTHENAIKPQNRCRPKGSIVQIASYTKKLASSDTKAGLLEDISLQGGYLDNSASPHKRNLESMCSRLTKDNKQYSTCVSCSLRLFITRRCVAAHQGLGLKDSLIIIE